MEPPRFATHWWVAAAFLTLTFAKLGVLLPFVIGSYAVPSLTFQAILLAIGAQKSPSLGKKDKDSQSDLGACHSPDPSSGDMLVSIQRKSSASTNQ